MHGTCAKGRMMAIQRITPFLWFDTQAEEAAQFYTSIFPNSKIVNMVRNGEGGPAPAGTVLTVEFELDGLRLVGLNGGPHFKFTEAVSFVINCDTQDEIDRYWEKLTSDGGAEVECGWLKDKFGLSWQVVPSILPKLLSNPGKGKNVMQSLMKMKKLDIRTLEAAAS